MPDAATWEQCLADFLTDLENRTGSRAARSHYLPYIRKVFKDFSRDPATYSRAEIIAFINAPSFGSVHHGLPVAPATKRHRQAAIASFLKYASSYSIPTPDGPMPLLGSVPVTVGMRYPRATVAPRGLSDDELSKLFSSLPDDLRGVRDRSILLAFLLSLRRRSELASLRRGDFTRVTFPSGRVGWSYRFHNKGDRTVDDRAEMPGEAMAAILRYVAMSGRDWSRMEPGEAVWLAMEPDQGGGFMAGKILPMSGRAMNKMLKRRLKLAGLDTSHSLHALRHSGAKARYESGQDLRSVQHALRHKNISTTDTYIRIMIGDEDEMPDTLKERYGKFGR